MNRLLFVVLWVFMTGVRADEAAVLYPTLEEMRFMAFAAIVNGATGLLFSMHGVSTADDAIWPSIRQVSLMLASV